jgi:radical SAM superfamily enzyme YgiQ (UPF0313 family)
MKIFLLNPEPPYYRSRLVMRRNRVWPPITLAIIANGLELAGHDVRLLDANALHKKNPEIVKAIRSFAPDLLIYSSDRHDAWQLPVPDNGYIEAFFKALETGRADVETSLVIGPHGTLFPETILDTIPAIDFLVRGEPEEKVLSFVEALQEGEPRSAKGISYRKGNKEVVHNEDPGFIQDLDALPLPAYHLLPMHLYRDNTAPDRRFGLVVTSRGCPMACIFCSKSMYGSRFRTRSIEKVLEEVDLLVRRYQVGRIFFHDQILLLKRDRIETLLQGLVERKYDLTWRCQTRLANLDREILLLMKKAGCTEVHVGLESISPEVRQAVKKTDGDTEKFVDMHRLGEELGISISPNMIIGLPNETYETVMESARFYTGMGFHFLANVAIPYPDTKLYQIGVEEGKITHKDWASVVDAAGRPGNRLTTDELVKILADLEEMNKKLRRSKLTLAQKIRKAPGYVMRKLLKR